MSSSLAPRFPDSSIDTKLGDTPSVWAACLPVSPACSMAWRSPSPSSRLRIVGARCGMVTPPGADHRPEHNEI